MALKQSLALVDVRVLDHFDWPISMGHHTRLIDLPYKTVDGLFDVNFCLTYDICPKLDFILNNHAKLFGRSRIRLHPNPPKSLLNGLHLKNTADFSIQLPND